MHKFKINWQTCPNGNQKAKLKSKNKFYMLEHHITDVDNLKRFYSIHEYDKNNNPMSVNTTFTDTNDELNNLLIDFNIIK